MSASPEWRVVLREADEADAEIKRYKQIGDDANKRLQESIAIRAGLAFDQAVRIMTLESDSDFRESYGNKQASKHLDLISENAFDAKSFHARGMLKAVPDRKRWVAIGLYEVRKLGAAWELSQRRTSKPKAPHKKRPTANVVAGVNKASRLNSRAIHAGAKPPSDDTPTAVIARLMAENVTLRSKLDARDAKISKLESDLTEARERIAALCEHIGIGIDEPLPQYVVS